MEPVADAAPPVEEARVGLGWRIAIVVWAAGFGGLMLSEVGGMLWKLVRG